MPKIVDKEAKKMHILHVAMRVFAQKGVVKTKMIDIATAAGIGKGTIYEYFTSKEDVFATSFEYFFQSLELSIRDKLKDIDDPVLQLRLIAELSLHSVLHGNGDYMHIMMDFWAEGVRNKNQEFLDKVDLKAVYTKYRNLIKSIIQSGIDKHIFRKVDTATAASVFIGLYDGIMLQWIMDPESINIDKVIDFVTDDFINGIVEG
jgi:TetR/AcrR family fatty acid metabolism transcriptional regulator